MRTAAALVIGNELLSGKIQDQNVMVLARALRAIGVQFRRVVMVLDELDTIAAEVKDLSRTHDVVFTSGGVGPTHDDVTIDAVAKAFGVDTVYSNEIDDMLRAYYGERITPGHLAMAKVPRGSRLSRAKGEVWPAIIKENVWVLPGVPQIFAMKMSLVQEELKGDAGWISLAVHTTLDEGNLKDHLDRVVAAYPQVDIGSYPTWDNTGYRTKLTFDGLDASAVERARDAFLAYLAPEVIVALDK
ncbi:MAG: competence/damage-inducible protein A [Polyangiaceae bacterium]|nr:competence/damage-inducible protein A [Polyangiaceae bacterium]